MVILIRRKNYSAPSHVTDKEQVEKKLTPPSQPELLSPEAARLLLHELRQQQTILELKNEQLLRMQEELENSRARYYDFYHAAPVGFVALSNKATIYESNLALSRMLQTDESRLVQQSLTNYVHRDDRKLFAEMLETLFLNGKAQSLQLRLKQSKATYFWARIEAALAFDLVESTVARIVVIDITERKQAEEKQQRNSAVQTALREIAVAAVFSQSLDELYLKIHAAVSHLSIAEHFTIAILDEEKQEIVYHYRSTDQSMIPTRRAVGFGLTEYIMKQGRTLYLTTEDLARLRASGEDKIAYVKINTWLGAPLIDPSGRIFGSIALFSKQNSVPEEFLSTEVFSAIAAQVSQAIERKRAEHALQEKEMLLRTIVSALPDMVWLKDIDGRYIFCNQMFERFFGAAESTIIGKTDYDFVSQQMADLFREYDQRAVNNGKSSMNEECVTFADDQHVAYLETIKTPIWNVQGELIGVLGIARDISERKKMQEELQQQAITDELTGAFNRRHFMFQAEQELLRVRRYGGECSVLMLDLDSFKRINDAFGHPVGDKVLAKVAEICLATLRCTDLFGRIGGEEFAAILTGTDVKGAKVIAERLRKNIQEAAIDTLETITVSLSVSIGVATYQPTNDSLSSLMLRADTALYAAKSCGRNQVCVNQ